MTKHPLAVVATALVLAPVAALAGPGRAADHRLDGDSITWSHDFEPGQRLEIDTDLGSVEYRHGAGDSLSVSVRCENCRLSHQLDLSFGQASGGVRIQGRRVGPESGSGGWLPGWLGGGPPRVVFVVEGPARVDASIRTAGGDVTLEEVEGTIEVAASGGGIDLAIPQGVGFGLDAEAVGAEVFAEVRDLKIEGTAEKGRVRGSIGAGGRLLRLRSHGGDIRITVAGGI